MKKYLISIFAGFTLLLLQTTNVLAFYSDVSQTNPYYTSIKALYDLGRLPVESDNKFHPDDPLTNGELYKLIITEGMATISKTIDLPFSDVSKDSPYAPYIQTALDNKILKPFPEQKTFGLNNKVTKLSALTTMFNSLGIGTNYFFSKTDFPFEDITSDSSIAPLADKAAKLNILEPAAPTQFLQNKRITKGEAADYLYKIKQNGQPSLTITYTNPQPQITTTNSIPENDLTSNKNFATLLDVWSTMKNKFLYKDKLNDDQLIYAAIKGMVSEAKDKYTVFDAPSETASLLGRLSNKYEGIGIVIELIENKVTVITPFHDSPAEKAGIQGQDIIIKVDGVSAEGLSLEEVSAKIKGPSKSSVKITVSRAGKEMEFSVMRDSITIKRVNTKTLKTASGKSIAYISLADFGQGADEEFAAAAKELIKNKPNGFIIDLRNNPGGYVDTAVNIISLFTNEAKVAVKMEFVDKHVEETKTEALGLLNGYKIVVLINEGSASASEITAGALKDYGIATLVGKKSFGKGVAQELRTYKDGSLLKYTISNWLTPNGSSINKQGITPDVTIERGLDPKVDAQLDSALGQF
ncbi:MAG: S41 family peptidase [Candidatus Peregrinibacteria bacterium]|nr:S41 family peptidase [Candidatus Peregrinibacteria bacterium]